MTEWFTTLRLKLRALLLRRKLDRDLRDELQFHLDMKQHNAQQVPFGNPTVLKERSRDLWSFVTLENIWRDIIHGARILRKSPGFTIAAVLTLALGIGANTAIFSVVRAVLFNSLPYPNLERLVVLHEALPYSDLNVSWPDFLDWRKQNRVFEKMAAYVAAGFTVSGAEEPVIVPGALVSPEIFDLLGVQPALGRLFTASDDTPSSEPAAIISFEFWQQYLKGDPGIVGKTIAQERSPVVVIGVLPAGFRFPGSHVDVYNTIGRLGSIPDYQNRANHPGIVVFASLRPGVTLDVANADMATIMQRLGTIYPKSNQNERATIAPMYKYYLGDLSRSLFLLAGAALLVLVLACFNVANLLLARAAARETEFGVRAALGAARGRLIRQSLIESVLLSFLGGGAGLALGTWAVKPLLRLAPESIPNLENTRLDAAVLLFALGASIATGLLFGLVPAIRAIRARVNALLQEGRGRLNGTLARNKLKSALLLAQVAIAVIVVVGATLLMRSLGATLAVNPGFVPAGLLFLQVALSGPQPNENYDRRFVSAALEKLRAIPGVISADAVMCPPLQGNCLGYTNPYFLDGSPEPPETQKPWTFVNMATPGYFSTMRQPLLAGRYFTESDNPQSTPVVIVNQALARKLDPNGDVLGKRLKTSYLGTLQIVGVAGDVKYMGLTAPTYAEIYLPYAQAPYPLLSIVLRTAVEPASLTRAAKTAIHDVDKTQPISHVMPASRYILASVERKRFSVALLGIFAALALSLAAIGVYGVSAYNVNQRVPEIGLRIALGARTGDVLRFAMGANVVLVGGGLLAGLAVAPLLTRLLAHQLFGITAHDPLSYGLAAILLLGVAVVACYLPARRALRVDAMVALRHQ
ncbi:MAG TPA: ABC transporter permease [Bryobacteraceae bacterium]|nr:ABC transporter permease [Bryobacteraceae bacterium]